MCMYYVFCRVLPRQVQPAGSTSDSPMRFEHLAETEGYCDGEQSIDYSISSLEGLPRHESSSGVESMREETKHDV
jgi:hypothetical protein